MEISHTCLSLVACVRESLCVSVSLSVCVCLCLSVCALVWSPAGLHWVVQVTLPPLSPPLSLCPSPHSLPSPLHPLSPFSLGNSVFFVLLSAGQESDSQTNMNKCNFLTCSYVKKMIFYSAQLDSANWRFDSSN